MAKGRQMKLTAATLQKLKVPPGAADKIFFDEGLSGFGLRVRGGGKRTWIAQYRVGAKQRRVTLGTVENLDAQAARQRAKDVLSKVHLGGDPQSEKAERRAQASVTVDAMIDRYLAERAAKRLKPRSFEEVERHLKKHWSALSGLPIRSVTRSDVAAQLGRIAKDNGPFASNRARAALSAFFSWAIGEGLADATPVLGTNKATEEISRDRVLSGEELAAIWNEAGRGDYGSIVRLLILTGQRREEVGGMVWPEIDLDKRVWRIDAERTKNGLAHDVPLSSHAVEILKKRERSGRALVFGSREGPFQGWSNAKSALDRRVLATQGGSGVDGSLKPWRLHDIRRTVATRMGDLGIQPHVIEAVLNHISGYKACVAGVYNRATYAAEKRRALDLWGVHVADLAEGRESNVVAFRGGM
jgi:integrase